MDKSNKSHIPYHNLWIVHNVLVSSLILLGQWKLRIYHLWYRCSLWKLWTTWHSLNNLGTGLQTPLSLIHYLIKVTEWSFVKMSLPRHRAKIVEDGAFSHIKRLGYNFLEDSKSRMASKLHNWFKSNGNFAEWVDRVHWWSFSGGGSAINGATPSILNILAKHFNLSTSFLFS